MRTSSSRGFSLVELLIVVTIILIIAAIAIPKLEAIKQQSQAASAIANLKSLNNALATYAATYADQGFPRRLSWLGPATGQPSSDAADLVDESLANAHNVPKQGYLFTYHHGASGGGTPITQYQINADPQNGVGQAFYTDDEQTIRYSDAGSASATDPPIGQ